MQIEKIKGFIKDIIVMVMIMTMGVNRMMMMMMIRAFLSKEMGNEPGSARR